MPIKLNSASGGSVTLDVPATASTYTHTFPAETGTVLTTASTLNVNASSISTGTLPKARLPSGSILQVVQSAKTDVFSTSSTSYTDVTGMSVSITPASTSNKILVICGVSFGSSTVDRYAIFGRLMRNGSAIFIADAASNRDRGTFSYQMGGFEGPLNLHFNYLDSPSSTSSVTYNIQIRAESPQTAYINRGLEADGDSSITPRTASSITVMEIVG